MEKQELIEKLESIYDEEQYHHGFNKITRMIQNLINELNNEGE